MVKNPTISLRASCLKQCIDLMSKHFLPQLSQANQPYIVYRAYGSETSSSNTKRCFGVQTERSTSNYIAKQFLLRYFGCYTVNTSLKKRLFIFHEIHIEQSEIETQTLLYLPFFFFTACCILLCIFRKSIYLIIHSNRAFRVCIFVIFIHLHHLSIHLAICISINLSFSIYIYVKVVFFCVPLSIHLFLSI